MWVFCVTLTLKWWKSRGQSDFSTKPPNQEKTVVLVQEVQQCWLYASWCIVTVLGWQPHTKATFAHTVVTKRNVSKLLMLGITINKAQVHFAPCTFDIVWADGLYKTWHVPPIPLRDVWKYDTQAAPLLNHFLHQDLGSLQYFRSFLMNRRYKTLLIRCTIISWNIPEIWYRLFIANGYSVRFGEKGSVLLGSVNKSEQEQGFCCEN